VLHGRPRVHGCLPGGKDDGGVEGLPTSCRASFVAGIPFPKLIFPGGGAAASSQPSSGRVSVMSSERDKRQQLVYRMLILDGQMDSTSRAVKEFKCDVRKSVARARIPNLLRRSECDWAQPNIMIYQNW
jgi:hypothetical protein